MQVGIGTVNRDLSYLRQQAKENIRRYIDQRLPEGVREMPGWVDCNAEGSMEYFAADRRQEREDTSLVISQRLLFNEAGFAY